MLIKTEERIQVSFEIDGFRDALYFTAEQRAALSAGELDAMKLGRYEAHRERLAAPVKVVPLTEEQVAARLDDLVRQKAAIEAELGLVPVELVDASYVRTGVPKGDGGEILEPVGEPIVRVR